MLRRPGRLSFFFFNDTATTEIYTLSLHDALRICDGPASARLLDVGHVALAQHAEPDVRVEGLRQVLEHEAGPLLQAERRADRKSTRLNSSHANISYAVFCLKKKKQNILCRLPPVQ